MSPVDKTPREEKESDEQDRDLRYEWEKEDREMDGSAPDLEEIEEDTSKF